MIKESEKIIYLIQTLIKEADILHWESQNKAEGSKLS